MFLGDLLPLITHGKFWSPARGYRKKWWQNEAIPQGNSCAVGIVCLLLQQHEHEAVEANPGETADYETARWLDDTIC